MGNAKEKKKKKMTSITIKIKSLAKTPCLLMHPLEAKVALKTWASWSQSQNHNSPAEKSKSQTNKRLYHKFYRMIRE